MSVWAKLMAAAILHTVPTQMEASLVDVSLGSLEMAPLVQVVISFGARDPIPILFYAYRY